ncbi:MAG: ferric reductase-like transmembrane domain-containing protein [Rhodospirillales bacterium]|nr:ferric reductase-like transmembrane domain-containing protein [Rhodospirillales bacterium]
MPTAAPPARRRSRAPWRDRRGAFSWLKALALAGCIAPGATVAVRLAANDLGGRPVKAALLWMGLWTVRFVLIALAISPAAQGLRWPNLTAIRRMVGVTACVYALGHLALYATDENWRLGLIGSEILRRFYLTIGFVALLGLAALAATSFDAAVRRMGRGWKRLHRLAYPIAALALLHYFIQSKANVGEPTVMAGLFAWAMLWRVLPSGWRGHWAAVLPLAAAAGLAAAGIEFAWYGLATGIDPWRVLGANLIWRFAPRPAHWAALASLGLGLLLLAGRGMRARRGQGGRVVLVSRPAAE